MKNGKFEVGDTVLYGFEGDYKWGKESHTLFRGTVIKQIKDAVIIVPSSRYGGDITYKVNPAHVVAISDRAGAKKLRNTLRKKWLMEALAVVKEDVAFSMRALAREKAEVKKYERLLKKFK